MNESSPWYARWIAPLSLLLIFGWVYGRSLDNLYFVMDDFINATGEMHASVFDALMGAVSWSGYRPLTIIQRILMYQTFGLDNMRGYYLVMLGLHLANTLLAYGLVLRIGRNRIWAFVAAAIMLLLPSHNEAVFWFGANANLLAAFFGLLALHCAVTYRLRGGWLPLAGTLVFYACAVLSFEVLIVLPFLIALADWIISRNLKQLRTRWRFYLALGVALFVLLAVRTIVPGAGMLPTREDYAFSLAPTTLLHGYWMVALQLFLLASSPMPTERGYTDSREWMPLATPEAWIAFALTTLCVVLVFLLANRMRQPEEVGAEGSSANPHFDSRTTALWFGWGLLWILLLALPFAGLTERNPENRYMYLLGFGLGVSVASLGALVWHWLRLVWILRGAVVVVLAALLGFYAYTSVSDAAEWERASSHTRAYTQALDAIFQGELPAGSTIATIGLPFTVGGAYVFQLQESFAGALDLQFGARPQRGIMGEYALRDAFANGAPNAEYYVFRYSDSDQTLLPIVRMRFCDNHENCIEAPLRYLTEEQDSRAADPMLFYVQLHNAEHPEWGTVSWIGPMEEKTEWGCLHMPPPNGAVAIDPAAPMPTYEEMCAEAMRLAYD